MTTPVDLTDLRSMTDGDKDLELALFDEFKNSAEKFLAILSSHCTDGLDETWRSSAHAFKGISYNLGAIPLGELCKQAQEKYTTDANTKRELVSKMQAEYLLVKAFLAGVH